MPSQVITSTWGPKVAAENKNLSICLVSADRRLFLLAGRWLPVANAVRQSRCGRSGGGNDRIYFGNARRCVSAQPAVPIDRWQLFRRQPASSRVITSVVCLPLPFRAALSFSFGAPFIHLFLVFLLNPPPQPPLLASRFPSNPAVGSVGRLSAMNATEEGVT